MAGDKLDRPAGISAIAISDLLLGVFLLLVSAFNLLYAPLVYLPIVVGVFFISIGFATWTGMSWAWHLLTFGGGIFGWYFARNDVKGFFGIRDPDQEPPYSGD